MKPIYPAELVLLSTREAFSHGFLHHHHHNHHPSSSSSPPPPLPQFFFCSGSHESVFFRMCIWSSFCGLSELHHLQGHLSLAIRSLRSVGTFSRSPIAWILRCYPMSRLFTRVVFVSPTTFLNTLVL